MKQLLLTAFIALSCVAFAQETTRYEIDDLSLNLPEGVDISDSANEKVYSVAADEGLILVSRMVDSEALADMEINDEQSLKRFYKFLSLGLLQGMEAKLISDTVFQRGGLTWSRLVCEITDGDETELRYCESLLLNKKIYTVYYCNAGPETTAMQEEREALFASAATPEGLGMADQFNAVKTFEMPKVPESSSTSNRSWFRGIGRIAVSVAILAIAGGVRAARNRKKKNEESGF